MTKKEHFESKCVSTFEFVSGCVSTSPFSDKLSVILTKRTFIKKSKICCLSVYDVIVINRKMVEKSDNMVENGLVETQPHAVATLSVSESDFGSVCSDFKTSVAS